MIDLRTTDRQYLHIDEFAVITKRSRRTIYYWIETGKLHIEQTRFGQRIPIAEARRVFAYVREDCQLRSVPAPLSVGSVQSDAKFG